MRASSIRLSSESAVCAKAIELNTDWWNEQPRPRQLLAMLCLLVASEDHPAMHWNGENGEVETLYPDGTRNYEMVPPPISDFRSVLNDLKVHFSLYQKEEIEFEIPLESEPLRARIRLERRDYFPHLYCEIIASGIKAERVYLLDSHFNGSLPLADPRSIYTTIRGKVVDHLGQPVSGVRLADRKINWRDFQMEKVQPDDLDSNMVVFSNRLGEFELQVELTPGIPDLKDVVVVFKSDSISRWQEVTFPRSDIESNPNDVTIQLSEPGRLKIEYDFSGSQFANEEHLQIGVYQLGYSHLADVESAGEMMLSGLIPGIYRVGFAVEGKQVIGGTVEVSGSKIAELKLTPIDRLETVLKLKIFRGDSSREIVANGDSIKFRICPDSLSVWGQQDLYWELALDKIELNCEGVFEQSYRMPPMIGGIAEVGVVFNRDSNCQGGWNDSETVRLYHELSISGEPLTVDPKKLEWTFESGLRIELQIMEVAS
jgi:hypothetical protein